MIYESFYYKNELARIAKRMEKRLSFKRWDERSYFPFEKDIFFAFYIIRKLIESKSKISRKTSNLEIPLKMHEYVGREKEHGQFARAHITTLDICQFFKFYDMENARSIKKNIAFVCNKIIHSFIFNLSADEDGSMGSLGIYFNSNSDRKKAVYHVYVKDIIPALNIISKDYPENLHYFYAEKAKDWVVVTK